MYAWGANSHGQLGLGNKSEQCVYPTEVKLPNGIIPRNIRYIAGGGGHTIITTCDGEIWVCGWNNKGQLSVSTNIDFDEFQISPELSKMGIEKVFASWDSNFAITKSRNILGWGANTFGQLGLQNAKVKNVCSPVEIPSPPVTQIACGLRHTIAITSHGHVLSWGTGRKGQLGLKFNHTQNSLPQEVSNLSNIESIACGEQHSVALTISGELWSWGDNRYGQLGLNPSFHQAIYQPQQVQLIPGEAIPSGSRLFSGWNHSLILTRNNKQSLALKKTKFQVFGSDIQSVMQSARLLQYCVPSDGKIINWGRNDYGQLGCQPSDRKENWKPNLLENVVCADINVGSHHNTAIFVNGQVHSWGWNEHGNCGTGTQEDIYEPTCIGFQSDKNISYISGGASHNFVLIDLKD